MDIRKVNYGGYSTIYRIGDKIIKIGCTRICDNIPDNSRLLIPDFKGFVGKDFVEITDYLDITNDINSEEIYQIYKELREQTVRWLDSTEFNLARLNEKVLKRLKEKRKNLNLEEVGIIKNEAIKEDDLKVGDLVIIDLDHMFWDFEEEKMNNARMELNEILIYKEQYYDEKYRKEKEEQLVLTKKV